MFNRCTNSWAFVGSNKCNYTEYSTSRPKPLWSLLNLSHPSSLSPTAFAEWIHLCGLETWQRVPNTPMAPNLYKTKESVPFPTLMERKSFKASWGIFMRKSKGTNVPWSDGTWRTWEGGNGEWRPWWSRKDKGFSCYRLEGRTLIVWHHFSWILLEDITKAASSNKGGCSNKI